MSEQKTCKTCSKEFEITSEDKEFYEKMQVSEPTNCPECRQRRRLTWRGERQLYSRKCDQCGQPIITVFSPDSPYKVYCRDCWWGDKWSAKDTGKEFDFSRPFFEQFEELLKTTPLLFSWNIYSENSEYNNNVSYLKNCYLLSSSNYDEDSYYGYFLNDSKNCVDCTSVKKSEYMYECIECMNCYSLKFSQSCTNCRDSWFLQNCVSCSDCFGCIDMHNKQYCYLNEQLSKEDYEKKIAEFNSGDLNEIKKQLQLTYEHHLKYPFKYMIGELNEDVSGNAIYQSKNTHFSFDCIQVEDSKFCHQMQEAKNCYDIMTWGRPAELLYDCMAIGANAYMNKFSAVSQDCSYNAYCYMCMFSKNLFGCVSMKRGEYCILNKQYSKEEYEELMPKIIEHMKKSGEWGEFFPSKLSPFAYNEALSNDWLPLTKEQALKMGQKWKDPDKKDYQPQTYQVAGDIKSVTEVIVQQILACKNCGKNYKIIPQEFVFYKTYKLPVPEFCPSCRHIARMKKRNPRHLWHRQCMCSESNHNHEGQCKNEFETTYAPDRKEKVYCEECYQKSII